MVCFPSPGVGHARTCPTPTQKSRRVLLHAMEALGGKPEDCLMIGDSTADMEAGRRAGVKICAVRHGYGKAEDLARFDPDFWIDDLRELCNGSSACSGMTP